MQEALFFREVDAVEGKKKGSGVIPLAFYLGTIELLYQPRWMRITTVYMSSIHASFHRVNCLRFTLSLSMPMSSNPLTQSNSVAVDLTRGFPPSLSVLVIRIHGHGRHI